MDSAIVNGLNRRDFIGKLAMGGAAAYIGTRPGIGLASMDPPPETTTIKFQQLRSICWAPLVVAESLLREEGFTDIQYVKAPNEAASQKQLLTGDIDMSMGFIGQQISVIEPGSQMMILSGLHSGCYSLIGNEKIKTVRDLKGKRVWAWSSKVAGPVTFFKTIVAYVGLDPDKDIEYVIAPVDQAVELFKKGEVDAIMSFPPGPQQLRAAGIGKELVNTNFDRPWSQYFCCTVMANKDFTRKNPVATKRALRAFLKANDLIANHPKRAAKLLVDKGLKPAAIQDLMAQVAPAHESISPTDSQRIGEARRPLFRENLE